MKQHCIDDERKKKRRAAGCGTESPKKDARTKKTFHGDLGDRPRKSPIDFPKEHEHRRVLRNSVFLSFLKPQEKNQMRMRSVRPR